MIAGLLLCGMLYAYPPTEVPPTYWVQEVEEGEYIGEYDLTAYTHTGNNCADGVYPCAGVTVACNDTKLWHKTIRIEGYGDFYVHDTGSMAVMGTNTIDIFVDSYNEAIQFGRKKDVKVYILEVPND
jgi:3D (Asp-Asp-Asp) domain-containing protein